ncbi:flagellar motor protein PomA [Aeromonas salmonicida]|uniref:Flagellar motor protein PomA n=1 Tax=Aeromonas salmonicida subsp. pectinolytica 34mel TaxID=1324960 RepID=T0PPV5_AERSA|nr:flagellar motor protein PomA [Aeromonas salmonicida]ATP10768.1 flagellar motor protein PomA [Aeromonas salmonicida subsp. pectinolytica 34mel]EQC06027.1 chemotaxis protein PomA [Aeromonas salmonicida subsp. pectinolytica 34mel]MBS2780045.1 flagellar motor protein PomA [Aeromonas salmonicida]MDR6993972.1 chemotaxis protein MotA [Aeromonas salmonicida]MDR7020682.1 chemotaxis protein MotA [Aeromonas salmonicida]
MDLGSLIGIILGFGVVGYAMVLGGGVGMFVDVPSILITFMGSIFVGMMKFNIGQFFLAFKVAGKAFMYKGDKLDDLILKSVELADAARKGGFLALEAAEIPNTFMKKGIDMLVDGHDADVVRSVMEKDIDLTEERHTNATKVFRALGDLGPAMGMIGTLVGLVAMLSNMSDPKSIGPAMAVALLTTLYGAILANMFAIPIADKLDLRNSEERLSRSLILDAIMGIQDGQNPRVIESLLKNYLHQSKREQATE